MAIKAIAINCIVLFAFSSPCLAQEARTGFEFLSTVGQKEFPPSSIEGSLPNLGSQHAGVEETAASQIKRLALATRETLKSAGASLASTLAINVPSFTITKGDLQRVKESLTLRYTVFGVDAQTLVNPIKGSLKTDLGSHMKVNLTNLQGSPSMQVQYQVAW